MKELKDLAGSGEPPELETLNHAENYQMTVDDLGCAEYFTRVK